MPSLSLIVRKVWRALPGPLRDIGRNLPGVRAAGRRVRQSVEASAGHQDIYDEAYYDNRDAEKSARAIADSLVAEFSPTRVLDLGCGTGDLLNALREHGVEGLGLELSDAALKVCRERGLNVRQFDLEVDDDSDIAQFDVVVSTEVAEHLPERCADRYVEMLATHADIVVFTAAPPGQGGTDHVNEQPPEYWLEKFAGYGFAIDRETTDRCSKSWRDAGAQPWYHENVMALRRTASA